MTELKVATRRGTVLDGVLFGARKRARTVVIAITGIHGNFCSNPFYYDIGAALNAAGVDFIYAQTRDAFGEIPTRNALTDEVELIGSWNERFAAADADIAAYLNKATFLAAAAHLAERVSVPVVLVGGLRSVETMNRILNETKIDYLALSRPLIREPGLVDRWRRSDLRPALCVSCNNCYRTRGHACIF